MPRCKLKIEKMTTNKSDLECAVNEVSQNNVSIMAAVMFFL